MRQRPDLVERDQARAIHGDRERQRACRRADAAFDHCAVKHQHHRLAGRDIGQTAWSGHRAQRVVADSARAVSAVGRGEHARKARAGVSRQRGLVNRQDRLRRRRHDARTIIEEREVLADVGGGSSGIAVLVGDRRGQGDQGVVQQRGRLIRTGVGAVEHGPRLIECDIAIGGNRHGEDQQIAASGAALDSSAAQHEIDCLTGQRVDQTASPGHGTERVSQSAAGCGTIGTKGGGEDAGEVGRGVGGERRLIDGQHGLGERGARCWRIVVDADCQSARCAVAVCIGNGVVQRKGLVVLVTASGVHDRRKLRDGVSTGRRIKRDYHDLDGALEHVDPGAVGSIREASRSARVRQCPGQRAVAARTRQRTGGVGGIGSDVVGAAGVAAGQRVIVEQDGQIGAGERSCIGDADCQRCSSGVTVSIGHRIGERVGDIAWSSAVAGIAVAPVGVKRQHAILAGGCAADRACTDKAGDRGNRASCCRAVGTKRIRACGIAVAAGTGQDIADGGSAATREDRVGVIRQNRGVIIDCDCKIADGGNAVTVAVGGGQQRAELDQKIVLVSARRMVELGGEREGPIASVGIEREGEDRGCPGFCGDHIAGYCVSKRDAARSQSLRRQTDSAGCQAIA